MYFTNDRTNFETRNDRTLPAAHQPRELVTDAAIRESVYGTVAAGTYFDGVVTFRDSECQVRVNGETVYENFLLARCIAYATRHGLAFTHEQEAAPTQRAPRVLGTVPSYGRAVDPYRELQKEMFGAFNDVGLSREKDEMLPRINAMLGTNYGSHTLLDESEMKLVAAAVRGGYFDDEAAQRRVA